MTQLYSSEPRLGAPQGPPAGEQAPRTCLHKANQHKKAHTASSLSSTAQGRLAQQTPRGEGSHSGQGRGKQAGAAEAGLQGSRHTATVPPTQTPRVHSQLDQGTHSCWANRVLDSLVTVSPGPFLPQPRQQGPERGCELGKFPWPRVSGGWSRQAGATMESPALQESFPYMVRAASRVCTTPQGQ